MNLRNISAATVLTAVFAVLCPSAAEAQTNTRTIDSQSEWSSAIESGNFTIDADGLASPTQGGATFRSTVQSYAEKQTFSRLTFRQSAAWGASQWTDVPSLLPLDGGKPVGDDAPVFLSPGDGDYWYFNAVRDGGWLYGHRYQAWHSTDMQNWSERMDSIGTALNSAEHADGEYFLHYGNDANPALLVDSDLTNNYTESSDRTSHGSRFGNKGGDVAAFRDLDGTHHIIYEDWSPFDDPDYPYWENQSPSAVRWDSPLAGHASSDDGVHYNNKEDHTAAIDLRHEGNAYGDYEMIRVGDTYYLFSDYHPEGAPNKDGRMSLAYFYSKDLDGEFEFGGLLRSKTHPDPTVGFAEGEFVMIIQSNDGYEGDDAFSTNGDMATLTSTGPWVDGVQARAGVDTDGDGEVDVWTDWQDVSETYGRIEGFAKVYSADPAMLDLTSLPDGYGIQFEFSTADMAAVMDSVTIESTTIPEPATMSLLALGGLGVLLRRRKA